MRAVRALRPVSLMALTAALLSPGLWLGPGFDGAVYTLAGVVIREGRMPYTALFDNKPPGLYLLNASGQLAMPWLDPWVVSWLLTFAFTAATVLVVDRLLRRWMSPIASYLLSLVCLAGIASFPVALGGGLTESVAILPLVVALWAIAAMPSGRRTAALVACLGSLACLTSVHAVPIVAILVGAAVLADAGPREAARRAIVAAASGAVIVAAVAGWLAARGAMGDAIDQVLVYNTSYRDSSEGIGLVLPAACLMLCGLMVPVAVSVIRMVRDPRSFGRVYWLCLAWGLAEAALLGYENRIFLHYLILLVPPALVLSGPGFGWLRENVRSPLRGSRNGAVLLTAVTACLFVISGVTVAGFSSITLNAAGHAGATTKDTSAWIKANMPPSATVFLWGNDSYIYLLVDRPWYDRHVYQFPMVTRGYWSPEKTAAMLSEWNASPPSVVVETPATVELFRAQHDPGQQPNYDTFGPLRDFVRAHYRLVASFGTTGGVEDIYVLAAFPT